MTFVVEVDFGAPPRVVFDWLADLDNRPLWQASLRAVATGARPPYDVGTRWVDVTWAGVRPLMEVTTFERAQCWGERGHWHGVRVDLTLDLAERPGGTTVRATGATSAPGWRRPIGWGLALLGPVAARDDLHRAARLLSGGTENPVRGGRHRH